MLFGVLLKVGPDLDTATASMRRWMRVVTLRYPEEAVELPTGT